MPLDPTGGSAAQIPIIPSRYALAISSAIPLFISFQCLWFMMRISRRYLCHLQCEKSYWLLNRTVCAITIQCAIGTNGQTHFIAIPCCAYAVYTVSQKANVSVTVVDFRSWLQQISTDF